MLEYIDCSKFQTNCLEIIKQVQRSKKKIIITKGNKPIAQLIPIEEDATALFGKMKGTVQIVGDIISPTNEEEKLLL